MFKCTSSTYITIGFLDTEILWLSTALTYLPGGFFDLRTHWEITCAYNILGLLNVEVGIVYIDFTKTLCMCAMTAVLECLYCHGISIYIM